ncbi:MAG: hypothetical protein A3A80_00160 [Candidatus Terrybacteria bacterium RIFCSPLOWO2_01_FULL_44_24]|uniref:Uncharacterized protein n=1 Tax=Candidatus Terrybacteria bacterium RIFCSPHIGHO2_01_FULL_43_35 TaxID=1802361 RepID=A0A1G2PCX8_9BACT|nr:MAG: hypothetical protein A2828_00670 [Candidatus Terrybacteria bacterium RIFCSPHIGHO2_01_FULL_43_35]OHA50448.1 MAG: hypothetical protein A3B75_00835 [Candidatus Terrybacteria bacterium RIFCSPHIGHO2_02_FULL_43_14]OHA51094.1 MAG: hypothetical protein A3A80_00160 [Candidatus Terrybacteria bacterium RIFCSPLOWO2_01_FULL_44_24]
MRNLTRALEIRNEFFPRLMQIPGTISVKACLGVIKKHSNDDNTKQVAFAFIKITMENETSSRLVKEFLRRQPPSGTLKGVHVKVEIQKH